MQGKRLCCALLLSLLATLAALFAVQPTRWRAARHRAAPCPAASKAVPAPEPAKLPPNVHCEDQNAVLGNCSGLLNQGITCEQKIA